MRAHGWHWIFISLGFFVVGLVATLLLLHVLADSLQQPHQGVSIIEIICNDGIDNDADGLVDCNDNDCRGSPYCP